MLRYRVGIAAALGDREGDALRGWWRKQAASKLAAAMTEAGYLVAAAGTDDGRVRPLRLTPRGRRLLG